MNGYNAKVLPAPGFLQSDAFGISDNEQVGDGSTARGTHALLWHGPTGSVVDLHPPGFYESSANAVHHGVQVGWGSDPPHALLWRGSAASVVNLHPPSPDPRYYEPPYFVTVATCVAGGFQGGVGGNSESHALMWKGTAQSVVDLHPANDPKTGYRYQGSYLHGISCDGTGVGFVAIPIADYPQPPPTTTHAFLWRGSAKKYVDLHPEGYSRSVARGMSGNKQVGYGWRTNQPTQALVWSGTRESVIELQRFLPPDFTGSVAMAIDEFGNILGRAVRTDGSGSSVLWVPDYGYGATPSLKIASWCEAGQQIKIQVMGEVGRKYSLQKSEDLREWRTLLETKFANPLFYYQDFDSPNTGHAFFRAALYPGAK